MNGVIDNAVELDEGQIVALLRPYSEAREQETNYGKQKTRLGELIKGFLERHEGMLRDGEHDIEARLQERHGADVYETERMPKALILALHKMGALRVDAAIVKAHAGQETAEKAKDYKRPGPVTTALVVEVKR